MFDSLEEISAAHKPMATGKRIHKEEPPKHQLPSEFCLCCQKELDACRCEGSGWCDICNRCVDHCNCHIDAPLFWACQD